MVGATARLVVLMAMGGLVEGASSLGGTQQTLNGGVLQKAYGRILL